jgi:hypothetical protein
MLIVMDISKIIHLLIFGMLIVVTLFYHDIAARLISFHFLLVLIWHELAEET